MMTRLTVITGVAITLLSVFGCGTNEDEYVEFEHTTPVTDAKSVDSVGRTNHQQVHRAARRNPR